MARSAKHYHELLRENESLRTQLTEAAREINCAGLVAHRIRVMKQEHQMEVADLQREVERLKADFEHLRIGAEDYRADAIRLKADNERLREAAEPVTAAAGREPPQP
jgi:predicted nuclease with TOPRIM domain